MSERGALNELRRYADLADIPGSLNDLAPVNLAAFAMEALQGRLPMEFLAVYLTAALEDHRELTRNHCPDELKASAYALDRVLEQVLRMVDPASGSRTKLKFGYDGKGRPPTKTTKSSNRSRELKRKGIFLYEKQLAAGLPPKAALADAAKAAGMAPRNFERVLRIRRIMDDPKAFAAYIKQGIEERRLARSIALAKAHFPIGAAEK